MILRNFGAFLGPTLTGKSSAPVSSLASLLLRHLQFPADDVVVVLAVRAVPVFLRVPGHGNVPDTLGVVGGLTLVADDHLGVVLSSSAPPTATLATLGCLLPVAGALVSPWCSRGRGSPRGRCCGVGDLLHVHDVVPEHHLAPLDLLAARARDGDLQHLAGARAPPGRHQGAVPEASLLRPGDVVVDENFHLEVQIHEGKVPLGSRP